MIASKSFLRMNVLMNAAHSTMWIFASIPTARSRRWMISAVCWRTVFP
jgi:hypothetical protein